VQRWVTRVAVSVDRGASWSEPRPLVAGDPAPRGPVKNKLLVLPDGAWLAPGSVEDDARWNAFVDRSADRGETWQRCDVALSPAAEPTAPVSGKVATGKVWAGLARGALWESDPGRTFAWDGVIQPSLWQSAPRSLHMLLRSTRGRIYRSDSEDGGRHWSPAYATKLPNNNSGLDLVRLTNGALLLACNPVAGNWASRTPLSLLTSSDNGESWTHQLDLEAGAGEFSYPAIIASGAAVHVAYTADRRTIVYREIAWG
jgi:predicted neuraminidase